MPQPPSPNHPTNWSRPEDLDKLIVAQASESEPDEIADLVPPDQPPVIPHMFTGPYRGPLAVVADVYRDEAMNGWVSIRTESREGSRVIFVTPEVAENLALELPVIASSARVQLLGPDD